MPSSREDVDKDKSWNQWLREEIPQLFVDTLSIFMVSTYLYCLTLPMEYRLLFLLNLLVNLPVQYFVSFLFISTTAANLFTLVYAQPFPFE